MRFSYFDICRAEKRVRTHIEYSETTETTGKVKNRKTMIIPAIIWK